MEYKIPKIIHYCWFGGNPLPELAVKCIDSWKKFCPDYEIVRWDESNFDSHINKYTEQAFIAKKWAFVSDVARLFALVNYGGIYMDTDVELIKPIDSLLQYEAISGFENAERMPTGLMGCVKGQKLFVELLHDYDNASFLNPDGTYNLETNVTRITNTCLKHGLVLNNKIQTIDGFTLLPNDYLCPKDHATKKVNITNNTLCIHHFDGSWLTEEDKYSISLRAKLKKFMPTIVANKIGAFIAILKYEGLSSLLKKF